MASIRKRKGSNVWWAQYYIPDPVTQTLTQIRKSTGTTNKKAAKIAALEMERAAQTVFKADSEKSQRVKAIFAEVVAEIEREKFTILAARKYMGKLLAIATGEEMLDFTIERWCEEWLRRKTRESSVATIARYKKSLDMFLSWLGDVRRAKPLETVTTADIRNWREILQNEGRAGKTVNKYVKDVGAAFRSAIREGLISANPCSALEAVSTEDSLDRKPFTIEEVILLIAAAPSREWRGLILIAAFTGLRLGDAARLKWESIDLDENLITLVPSKTKKKKREVRIPIQENLLEFLKQQREKVPESEVFVLPDLSKKNVNTRDGLSRTFAKIMVDAGVSRGKSSRDGEEDRGKGRVIFERSFHSLRHTFTSWLRSAGVAEEDRMALTGHTTRDSHAIYSHADAKILRTAIRKLPTLAPPQIQS